MGLLASQTYTAQYRGRVSIDPTFSSRGQLTQLFLCKSDFTVQSGFWHGYNYQNRLAARALSQTPTRGSYHAWDVLYFKGHASWPEGRWRKGFDPNLQTPSAI